MEIYVLTKNIIVQETITNEKVLQRRIILITQDLIRNTEYLNINPEDLEPRDNKLSSTESSSDDDEENQQKQNSVNTSRQNGT